MTNSTNLEVNGTDDHEVVIKVHEDILIDENLFKQEKMVNFFSFLDQSGNSVLNASLKFFYLTEEK